MNYNHLFYFHVVAREGSIAQASRILNVTQPTISEQIKQLEASLGASLFERSKGMLKLNPKGRQTFKYTERIFGIAGRLLESFEDGKTLAKSRIEVGMIVSASHTIATERLTALLDDESTVVRVRHGDNDYLINELINSGIDILITDSFPESLERKGISKRTIINPKLVAIVHKGHEVCKEGDVKSLLNHQRFIHFTDHSSYRWELDQFFRAEGIQPEIIAEFDDVHLMVHAVAQGKCAAIVPKSVIEESKHFDDVIVVGEVDANPTLYALFVDQEPSETTLRAIDTLIGK